MLRRLILLSGAALCSAALLSPATAQDPAAPKVTYTDHVLPIFKARCGSCHNANDKKGGLTLDNYASAMEGGASGPALEGGDPGSSYLWSLVNHESEPKMPPNADKLPETELAVIKTWIAGGLLENAGSTAKVKKMSAVAKVQVTGARPAEVALPQKYLGDPQAVAPRPNAVTALAVSPWASLAAVSSHQQIALFNTATLELLGVLPFPEGQPQVLKFSRSGALLLAGGGRGGASGKVVVFDVKTGVRAIEVGDEYDSVLAADISPDHTQIALGGPKKMLRVHSAATGELMYENKKHTDWVTAIEFSPDGVLLASGDRANGLVVWESFTGRPFHDLTGHQGAITDVSWRLDGNALGSASEDGSIRLWEMTNGTQFKTWNAHGGVASIEFVRDGRIVTTGRDRVVRLWNGEGAQVREFGGMTDLGLDVAFDAEAERVLGGDWTGIVRVWNAADGALLGQFDTNPPTLAMRVQSLQQSLAASEAQSQQTAAQLAALQKAMADKQAAAEAAVAKSNAAAEKAKQATAAKAEADKLLAEKTAAKATADKGAEEKTVAKTGADKLLTEKNVALKAAEEALIAAKTAYDKAAQEPQVAAKAVADATTTATEAGTAVQTAQATVTQATTTEKTAADEAAQLKAAADKAVAEAQPTPEQQKTLQDAQSAVQAAQQQLAGLKAALEKLQAIQAPPAAPAAP